MGWGFADYSKSIRARPLLLNKHLHGLGGQYKGIKIVRPAEAVRLIAAT
jgi:hypothetical protein